MAYERKTIDTWELQLNYGYGWEYVSSLLEDWQRNGELDTCKECGKMFNCYGVTKCPYCGADYEGGDE